MRRVTIARTALSITLLLSLVLLLLPAGATSASTSTWDFSNPSDYIYDPGLAQVSSGTAHSTTLDLENGWWTKTFDGGFGDDEAYAVSCDGSGNPVVAGYVTIDGGGLDVWVRKCDGSDGSTLWEKTYLHPTGNSYAVGVSCDGSGNPVVTASVWGGSNWGVWVRKYNGADGATVWTDVYHAGLDCNPAAVSCDPSGNPVVAGYVKPSSYESDFWVRKYNGADGAALWTQTYNVSSNDYGRGVSCDAGGNALVTGATWVGSNYDIWTGKFGSGDGSLLWGKLYDSGYGDESFGASCDAAGNPVVTGYTGSETGKTDIWVRKYDGTNGDELWTQAFDAGDWGQGNAVSCDRDGNPVVGGRCYNGYGYDIWVGKLAGETDGSLLWSKTWHSDNGDSWADGVSCDTDGNPVVSGSFYAGDNYDVWVRKYPPGDYAMSPSVTTKTGADLAGVDLIGFSDKTGADNAGNMSYQLSPDGSTFYYYDGANWSNAGGDPLKSSSAAEVDARIAEFNGIATSKLFVRAFLNSVEGMHYASLDEISVEKSDPAPPTSVFWYLAEGTNAWGFKTYITLENTEKSPVQAKLTYMDPRPADSGAGILKTRTITLPALSQTTVSSTSDIGEVDFSTKVESSGQIAVDRTMFWNGGGSTSGYHASVGTDTLSKTWYLPEGSSAWGFETWTAILNPNPTDAAVTLTYMTADGPIVKKKTLPANCRGTYLMAADIGAADASIKVVSDQPVIAERSMYSQGRREGSCSIGATASAADFYLAEGAVGYDVGFTTYVLVQNPNNGDNEVNLTYQTSGGPVPGPHFTMPPNSRKTIKVNDGVPANTDVSAAVEGTRPLVAERAMYWDNGTGAAFHASIGLASSHTVFMLPDGQTSGGFETWTVVENPNSTPAEVVIQYLPAGGGATITFTDTVQAGSRSSYNMADKIPSGRASIVVTSQANIIVERSMYKDNRGSGTATVGAFPE